VTKVALYPITRRVSTSAAIGFVSSRITEAALIIVVVVVSLLTALPMRTDLADATGAREPILTARTSVVPFAGFGPAGRHPGRVGATAETGTEDHAHADHDRRQGHRAGGEPHLHRTSPGRVRAAPERDSVGCAPRLLALSVVYCLIVTTVLPTFAHR
jgi:hypothetical protein